MTRPRLLHSLPGHVPQRGSPPSGTLPDHLPATSRGTQTAEPCSFFYLKEKKKKLPNHTKNKTNYEKEFRVALLALCALWRLPKLSLPWEPSAVHVHLIPTRASGTDSSHQLCATRPGHPPAGPPVTEGMGCVSGLFLPFS